jgi:hypothetical protein
MAVGFYEHFRKIEVQYLSGYLHAARQSIAKSSRSRWTLTSTNKSLRLPRLCLDDQRGSRNALAPGWFGGRGPLGKAARKLQRGGDERSPPQRAGTTLGIAEGPTFGLSAVVYNAPSLVAADKNERPACHSVLFPWFLRRWSPGSAATGSTPALPDWLLGSSRRDRGPRSGTAARLNQDCGHRSRCRGNDVASPEGPSSRATQMTSDVIRASGHDVDCARSSARKHQRSLAEDTWRPVSPCFVALRYRT